MVSNPDRGGLVDSVEGGFKLGGGYVIEVAVEPACCASAPSRGGELDVLDRVRHGPWAGPADAARSCRARFVVSAGPRCPASSTTPDPAVVQRTVRVTHPFHPWCGREFVFIAVRQTWGEDRAFFFDDDGT